MVIPIKIAQQKKTSPNLKKIIIKDPILQTLPQTTFFFITIPPPKLINKVFGLQKIKDTFANDYQKLEKKMEKKLTFNPLNMENLRNNKINITKPYELTVLKMVDNTITLFYHITNQNKFKNLAQKIFNSTSNKKIDMKQTKKNIIYYNKQEKKLCFLDLNNIKFMIISNK